LSGNCLNGFVENQPWSSVQLILTLKRPIDDNQKEFFMVQHLVLVYWPKWSSCQLS